MRVVRQVQLLFVIDVVEIWSFKVHLVNANQDSTYPQELPVHSASINVNHVVLAQIVVNALKDMYMMEINVFHVHLTVSNVQHPNVLYVHKVILLIMEFVLE